jgi:DNA-binding NarL/FixJ family response regulator
MTAPDPSTMTFEAAVAASLAGLDPGRELTKAERKAVAETLRGKGFTNRAVALHLGVSESYVNRILTGRPAKKGHQ